MTFFCSHQHGAETESASHIVPCQAQQDCQEVSRNVVGQHRQDANIAAVEDELDRLIAELHEQSKRAYERGDPIGARIYLDRADAARRSRSEEHQQRLHAKAWQRMLDEDYFGAMGQQDAAVIEGKA
jgi:uncharacterized protein YggL (DUF469 family)